MTLWAWLMCASRFSHTQKVLDVAVSSWFSTAAVAGQGFVCLFL